MANLANLNIGIGTDLGGLRSGLSKAQKQITSFSEGVESRLGSLSTGRLEQGLQNIGAKGVPSAQKLIGTIDNLDKKLAQAGSSTRGVAGVSRGMHKAFQQGTSQIRGTSAAVVNFNRVIQDAPFGIIGVANNLEPLISSFSTLKTQTGSTGGAIKKLLKSVFTGPGALITAVSVASSLLLVFGNRLFGAGEKSKEAKKEIEALTEAADNLRKVLSQDTGYADQIAREIERNKQAISLAKERTELEEELNLVRAGAVGIGDTKEQQQRIDNIKEEQSAINDLINLLGFENTELSNLEDNLSKIQKQQEIYNGVIGTSETKLAAYVDQMEGEAQRAIDNFEAGISTSTEQLEEQRGQVGNLLRSLQALARNGNEEARNAAIQLMKVFKDLNKALEEAGVEAVEVDTSFKGLGETADSNTKSFEEMAAALDKFIGKAPEFSIGTDDMQAAEGSIADLQMRLQAFQNMRNILDPASEGFEELTQSINKVQNRIKELQGDTEGFGKSSASVSDAVTTAFQAMSDESISSFQDLARVVANTARKIIAAEIATGVATQVKKALTEVPFPFNIAAAAAAGAAAAGLFNAIVPKFHEGGVVPGPLGKERLILAQGGETVMTPKQMKRGGTRTIQIPVYLNDRQIALATGEYNDRIRR